MSEAKKQKLLSELDSAKVRLKGALGRLETTVEAKIEASKKVAFASPSAKELIDIKAELEELKNEGYHLRDENRNMQSLVGEEQEKNRKLAKINSQVSERVDGLIKEIKKVMVEKSA